MAVHYQIQLLLTIVCVDALHFLTYYLLMSVVQFGGEASVSSSASVSDGVDTVLHRLSQMIVVERDDNAAMIAFITVTTDIYIRRRRCCCCCYCCCCCRCCRHHCCRCHCCSCC